MREVFTDPDYTVVGFLESELAAAGITTFIRNQYTNTSMAGIPLPLFWPILCVTDDDDFAAGTAIVARFVEARKAAPAASSTLDWICPQCGESIPASFDVCWKCETSRAPKTHGR